jgi:hypothetical protein
MVESNEGQFRNCAIVESDEEPKNNQQGTMAKLIDLRGRGNFAFEFHRWAPQFSPAGGRYEFLKSLVTF